MALVDVITGVFTDVGATCPQLLLDHASGTWTSAVGGPNATQATAGLQPSPGTMPGGQTYPVFDGTNDYLQAASGFAGYSWSSSHHTVFAFVGDFLGYGPCWIFDSPAHNNYVTGGGILIIAGAESNGDVVGTGKRKIIVIRNGATGVVTMYIDGVAQTVTGSANLGTDWGSGGGLYGIRGGLQYPFAGGLAAITYGHSSAGSNPFDASFVAALDAALQLVIDGEGGEEPEPIEATLAVTTDDAVVDGVADVSIEGSAAVALEAASVQATGTTRAAGGLAATLADAVASGVASVPAAGAVTATLANAEATGLASAPAEAAVAVALDGATLAAQARATAGATVAASLNDASAAASGAARVAAVVARTLDDATLSALVGAVPVRVATLSVTTEDAVAGAAALLHARASAAVELAPATGAGAAGGAVAAALAVELGTAVVMASAQARAHASGAVEADAATGSSTATVAGGAAVAAQLDAAVSSAQAAAPATAAIVRVLEAAQAAASAAARALAAVVVVLEDASVAPDGGAGPGTAGPAILTTWFRAATRLVVRFRPATDIQIHQRRAIQIVARVPSMPLHVGDTNKVDAEFRDPDENHLVDPSVVSVAVRSPSQAAAEPPTSTTYTYGVDDNVSRVDEGRYRVEIDCTEAGRWRAAWKSPGPVAKGVEPFEFDVEETV